MSQSRREFVYLSLGAAGALTLAPLGCAPEQATEDAAGGGEGAAATPLRILILGGTGFIGPHEVRYAQQRGHTLTLFNRGQTNPDMFPEVESLRGDRDDDLAALEGREWDVVIDNSASIPRWVRQSAGLLSPAARQYIYVSSISAFADFSQPGMDETAAVATIEDPTVEEITGATYGALKALCEQEAEAAFPGRATIVRPGLIVGPGDPTDRFTYWPVRVDRGGEVMAPGEPEDPVQNIDARDLTAWMIRLAEENVTGVFSATGHAIGIGTMLTEMRDALSSDATFTWVDADFLDEHEVQPWGHMTTWVPPRDGYEGFGRVSIERALAAGLEFRPLGDTTRDTVEWWNSLDEERRATPRAGLPAERETEVLAAWHAREVDS